MALSMQVHNLLSSAPFGASHMRPQAHTTCNQMDLLRHVWNLWSMHSNALSTVVLTHSLPFWHSELHPPMPSSHHLLSSCTNARFGPPFLPESATLIWQASQIHEWIEAHSDTSKPQADKWCKSLTPLYAGQHVVMHNTLHKIWIPASVVCVLLKDSYQVHTNNGMVFHHMRWHLCECSVKTTDTTLDITSATLQAPAIPHISVTMPAPAKPAQLLQPLPVIPMMPVTPKPQTPDVPEVAPVPAPMSATPSVSPVQPHRLGHACTAPKSLIQEL